MRDATLTFYTPAELLPIPTPIDSDWRDFKNKQVLINTGGFYCAAVFTDFGGGMIYFDTGDEGKPDWFPDEVIEWAYLPKGVDSGSEAS